MHEEIIKMLQEKQFSKVRTVLSDYNEADIAEILEEIMDEVSIKKAIVLFRMLPKNISAEVFSYLPSDVQLEIINGITDKETLYIMDELFFDDMIDLLEELPANLVNKILAKTEKEKRNLINQFLNYPEDSAGSIMTIEYAALKKEMTVGEALDYLKKNATEMETIYSCYVMDASRKLEGIVSLRQLVTCDDSIKLSEIMDDDVIRVNAHDDQEEIAQVFKKYGFMALPVVDNEERLIGLITIDDVIDVIDQENTEDIQKMAGVVPFEKEYLDISAISLAKKRIPWLLFLMCSAIVTGLMISAFEDIISQVTILVAFMPLIMRTGGNSGAQASTPVIRGIALGEIELSDIKSILWKEIRVSILVGVALSGLIFSYIFFIKQAGILLGLIISITLLLVIIIAKMIGGALPLLAKTLGLDPAIMAGPMITSIIDAVSILIYFAFASRFLL